MPKEMPLLEAEKKKEDTAPIQVTTEEQQEENAWQTVNEFHEKAKLYNAQGQDYTYLDQLDMAGLNEEMKSDNQGDAESFNQMRDSVDSLLTLAKNNGRIDKDKTGEMMTVSFFTSFYNAKQSVEWFIFEHSGDTISQKGMRRKQIALRLKKLIANLETLIADKKKDLPQENAQIIAYRLQGFNDAQIEMLMKTNQANKQAEEELAKMKAKELSEKLDTRKELLSGLGDSSDPWQVNMRLLERNVRKNKRQTYSVPKLQMELMEYIMKHVTDQELMMAPKEFQGVIDRLSLSFEAENRERINRASKRREQICTFLGMDANTSGLWEYPKTAELLLEESDEVFDRELTQIAVQKNENDSIMDEQLMQRISLLNRDRIRKDMYASFGANRLFATPEEMTKMVGAYLDRLKYTDTAGSLSEQTVTKAMDMLRIPGPMRDNFIKSISGGKIASIEHKSLDELIQMGKAFSERATANLRKLSEISDAPGQRLTRRQWDALTDLGWNCGDLEESELEARIGRILSKEVDERDQISREEYLSNRRIDTPATLAEKKARAEEDRKAVREIYKNSSIFQMKYLAFLSRPSKMEEQDPLLQTNAMLNGDMVGYRMYEEECNDRFLEREESMRSSLREQGIAEGKINFLVERLKPLMREMRSNADEKSVYERLSSERYNLEHFGVATWDDALRLALKYNSDLEPDEESPAIQSAAKWEQERRAFFEAYEGGRYRLMTDFLMEVPEFYVHMMGDDEKQFKEYMHSTLDKKIGSLSKGMEKADCVGDIVRQQYLLSHLRDIYQGKITGDEDFFSKEIEEFQSRMLMIRTEGGNSIIEVLSYVRQKLEEACRGENGELKISEKEFERRSSMVNRRLERMLNDPREYQLLFDGQAASEMVLKEIEADRDSVQTETGSSQESVIARIIKGDFLRQSNLTVEEVTYSAEGAVDREWLDHEYEAGVSIRENYLAINGLQLKDVRRGRSLVRVSQRGDDPMTLNSMVLKDIRKLIETSFGDIRLPKPLIEAIVEFGAAENLRLRMLYGYSGEAGKERLANHLRNMSALFTELTKPASDGAVMSKDEAQMFLLNLFSRSDTRKQIFDKGGDSAVSTVKGMQEYAAFRENYKKLKEFEALTVQDPDVKGELLEMSKNLRVMMITNIGAIGNDGNPIDISKFTSMQDWQDLYTRIGEVIDRHRTYIEESDRVSIAIRNVVDQNKNFASMSSQMKSRIAFGLRRFELVRLAGSLLKGKEGSAEGGEIDWEESIRNDLRTVPGLSNHITNVAASGFMESMSEADGKRAGYRRNESSVSKMLDQSTGYFNGRKKRYDMLDEKQKKIFAIALLLEHGTSDEDEGGSMELLNTTNLKENRIAGLKEELELYMAGKIDSIDIDIDYDEVINRLFKHGGGDANLSGYTLSTAAFDRAYSFAQRIEANKRMNAPQELEQANGTHVTMAIEAMRAELSIRMASVMSVRRPRQQNEVDKLSGVTLTLKDVRNKLMQYANYDRQDRMVERFRNMRNGDMRLFVRLMQDRMAIDHSTIDIDGLVYADQKKHSALVETLSAGKKQRKFILKGYDDNEACHKALNTALSFQLRDDINLSGGMFSEKSFAKRALNRRFLVDWRLIRRVFKLMDEIKRKRKAIESVRRASDYIEQSGNEKAITAHHELKQQYQGRENEMHRSDFETFITKYATADNREEAKSSIVGYRMLSDSQKRLFVHALGRRDILDISMQRNRNISVAGGEYEYVNKADRYGMMDDYVNERIGGGNGIQLDEHAHYMAAENLLSTQVSDRMSTGNQNADDDSSGAPDLVKGRSTAIDWRLFKRALQFVNRASQEAEDAAGNPGLYRSAGQRTDSGMVNQNYGFLQREFHFTGSRLGSEVNRRGTDYVQEKLERDETVKGAMEIVTGMNEAEDTPAAREEVMNRRMQSIGGANRRLMDIMENSRTVPAVEEQNARLEEEQNARTEEEDTQDSRAYYEKLKTQIDSIIVKSNSVSGAAGDIGRYMRDHEIPITDLSAGEGDVKIAGVKMKALRELATYAVEKMSLKLLSDETFRRSAETPVRPESADGEEEEEEGLISRDTVVGFVGDLFREALGEEDAAKILQQMEDGGSFFDNVTMRVNSVKKFVTYGQKCVAHMSDIYHSARGIRVLDQQVEENISLYGKKLGASQAIVTDAYRMGLQFAIYTFRCMTNRNMLRDYYTNTGFGRQISERISRSCHAAGFEDMHQQMNGMMQSKNTSGGDEAPTEEATANAANGSLAMIADCLGCDSVDELTRRTGRSIARSILFCASDFNPIVKTRLMAITVMNVMGLDSRIGKIDSNSAELLFRKFRYF